MLEFETATRARLVSFNSRSEEHGKLLVPAVDLRFSVDVPSTALSAYDVNLPALLYAESDQGQLDGIEHVSERTELRFPQLKGPLSWEESAEGYSLVIDYGIDDSSAIELPGARLHKHSITPMRGGTCAVVFTVSVCENLTPDVVGPLALKVKHPVFIRLKRVAGEPEDRAENVDNVTGDRV